MPEVALQIGEVARRLDLSINTIRHWHETGLAPPSGRSPGGFRLYTEADVARLAFIKRFRPLGFGIEEIREVLATRDALATALKGDAGPLVARLEEYIAIANERCAVLRDDLANAEGVHRRARVRRVDQSEACSGEGLTAAALPALDRVRAIASKACGIAQFRSPRELEARAAGRSRSAGSCSGAGLGASAR